MGGPADGPELKKSTPNAGGNPSTGGLGVQVL